MAQPEPTTWMIHLAARQPGRAVVVLLVILLALFAVSALGASPLITIFAALLLLGSVAEFLLPVTYTLDEAGARSRHLLSHRLLPWSRVRRVYLSGNRIKLSPLAVRSWADQFRGVTLYAPDRNAVRAQVRAWLDVAGASPEIIEES